MLTVSADSAVHKATDVAGHTDKDKARHVSCFGNLCFHDGEDSKGCCGPFGRFVEICLHHAPIGNIHAFSRSGLC